MKKKPKTTSKKADKAPGLAERLAQMFELPSDIVGNKAKVTAIGRGELLIENYKGIMEFKDDFVKINTHNGVISITGSGLTIREITSESLIMGGKISNIDYDA